MIIPARRRGGGSVSWVFSLPSCPPEKRGDFKRSIQNAIKTCTINGHALTIAHYQGQRVVSLAMVDEVHERPAKTAMKRCLLSLKRFIAGEDFFELTGSEIRNQSLTDLFPPRTAKGILLTESGYLMLAKSLTDDLAWQVQRQLVKGYFRAREIAKNSQSKNSCSGGFQPVSTI